MPVSQSLRTNRHLAHGKAHRTTLMCGHHSTKAGSWYSRPLASACVRLPCIYVGSRHCVRSHRIFPCATSLAPRSRRSLKYLQAMSPRNLLIGWTMARLPCAPPGNTPGEGGVSGVRRRVILASASSMAKSAAASLMPGVRSGVVIASVASRCPWELGWSGVGLEVGGQV